MISRILVPRNVKPAAAGETPQPRRSSTLLDARLIVPNELPAGPLETRSKIPAHVPLEVLGKPLLVPRDMPASPLETRTELAGHLPLAVLDQRVVVPRGAQPGLLESRGPVAASELPDVLDPDVFTTGEVNLLTHPVEAQTTGWAPSGNWQAATSSIVFHVALLLLFLMQPELNPFRGPTPEQIEVANRSLGTVYLPLGPPPAPPPSPPPASPKVRIDPRALRQILPPNVEPQPLPGAPENPPGESRGESNPPLPQPEPARPNQPQFETPKAPAPNAQKSPFGLRSMSPGRALEDSLRGATRDRSGSPGIGFGGDLPPSSGGGGGGGTGQAYGTMELLTPTEGVDFTNYLNRVLARVRRNWYAVIPESAYLGDKGKVMLQFRIMKDGMVPMGEPVLVRTSGKNPLDLAAMSSIRASNPFEPLPPAFSGPFIELRFIFLYNLPLDTP